jgi:hypothetical protein
MGEAVVEVARLRVLVAGAGEVAGAELVAQRLQLAPAGARRRGLGRVGIAALLVSAR